MEDQNQTGAPSDQSGSSNANPPAATEPSSVPQPEPAPQVMSADYIPPTAVPTPGYVTGPSTQTNTLAIVSLIASIASWLIIPGLGSIIGVICALIARNQIKASAGQQTGDGLAIAGLIIGALNLVLICLVLVCFVTGFAATILSSGGSR